MKSYAVLLAVAAFSLNAAPGSAQTVVAGRVVDPGKQVIRERLKVELLDRNGSVIDTSATVADGTFSLAATGAGMYRVRFIYRDVPTHVSDSISVAEGEYAAREFLIDLAQRPYFEFEVAKPVVPVAGSPQPRYPDALRRDGVSGCALVQFVVDTTGKADVATLRFLAYSDREFGRAVLYALPKMRFEPAELGGRKVRQLVQQPFTFTIVGDEQWECKPGKKP